jgi:hypothetical protein
MNASDVSRATMDKVVVIQCSLRCFTLGLIALLPGLGVPFAVMALASYFRVKRATGAQWNPAQQYLSWGLATALCGLFLTTVITCVIVSILVLNLT